MPTPLTPVKVVQNAYVVPDLEKAAQRLHELYRIGPFFVIPPHEMRDVVYRGRPAESPVVIEAAFAQSGDIVVELIQQSSPGPSAFRDMYADGEQGLHHVAYWSTNYAAEKQAFIDAGYEIAMEMSGRGDYKICYVDARPTVGHMIELYPDHPDLRGVYSYISRQTPLWDGQELILPLGG